MKGVKKCYGLLLVLFIIFGLSLSVSSDTSALKYELEYIPFTVPISYANNGISLYNSLRFESQDSFSMTSSNLRYFRNRLDDSSCVYQDTRRFNQSTNSNIAYFSVPFYLAPTDDSYTSDFPEALKCNPDGELPDNFLASTLPSGIVNDDLRSFLPYRYPYNAAFLRSNYTENGLNISNRLDIASLFTSDIPDGFTQIDIPLGISTLEFPSGTTLEFTGEFMFDSDSGLDTFTLNPDATLTLESTLLTNYDTFMAHFGTPNNPGSVSCSMWSEYHGNTAEFYPYSLYYSCPLTISSYTSLSGFTLQFRGNFVNYVQQNIFTYPNMKVWAYVGSFVVTNGDSTPTSDSFQHFEFNGNNISNSPGYAGSGVDDVTSGDVNWTTSLTNLFRFNFLNPFASIFNLFTDNSSCVSIPIIAGMLHSSETTYCPWFSSDVRNILTPVLGISSMMLLFGFLVRWLGSSSGNFFEDSKTEEVSNQGGRWGHFKKGKN